MTVLSHPVAREANELEARLNASSLAEGQQLYIWTCWEKHGLGPAIKLLDELIKEQTPQEGVSQ